MEKYKSATPPEYQTSNIRVKMQILYGTHDLLSQPQVRYIDRKKKLKNNLQKCLTNDPPFLYYRMLKI